MAKRWEIPGENGVSSKKKPYRHWRPYKLKNRKSMLSRVVISGDISHPTFIRKRAGNNKKHLKTKNQKKRLKTLTVVHEHDERRVKKMIPYYKKKYLRESQIYYNRKK